MLLNAIYAASRAFARQPARPLLARLVAVASLALAWGTADAAQYSCTFFNPNRTQYIPTPTQIVLMPGMETSGTKFSATDPGPGGPGRTVDCEHGAKIEPTEGLRRNIDIYLYFDTPYYQYVDSKTIRLGTSNFGLRLTTAGRTIQNNPLRMAWGDIGYRNDTFEIWYGNGGQVDFELVHLGSGPVDGSVVKLSESGLFARAMVAIKGVDPYGRDLVSNELVTLLWSNNEVPVSQTTCKVADRTVTLGTHDFGGGTIGSTSPAQDFAISMTNCPTGVPIYYRIDPTTAVVPGPPGANSSLMELDSSTSIASGVGIQLLHQDTSPLPLETKITLTSSGLAYPNYDLQLKARYYQISNSVVPGTANASATVTITHQ